MKLLISALTALGLMLSSITVLAQTQSQQKVPVTVDTYKRLDDFGYIFDVIRNKYIEPKTDQELLDAAIIGMFKQLDRHSTYMPPEVAKKMQQDSQGQISGIGAHVSQNPDTKEILLKPMAGSPAKQAGLLLGDHIVFVDGKDVRDLDLETALGLITGPAGSTVVLKIRREGRSDLLDYTVVRQKVNIPFIWSKILNQDGKNIMYLKMAGFNMRSVPEVAERIQSMIASVGNIDSIHGLIFDVRFNPGGLLTSAIGLSNMFMDQGLIVDTRNRHGIEHSVHATPKTIIPMDIPMVMLINEFSASASEVMSGTLGQSGRAIVIGKQSYGKGSVQTVMPLPNGGAMKLTTAKYHTNNGTTPHGVGIKPDIVVDVPEGYWKENNPMEETDDIDPQMERAISWIICQTCTDNFYKKSENAVDN